MKHLLTSLSFGVLASLLTTSASAQLTREVRAQLSYFPNFDSSAKYEDNRGPEGPRSLSTPSAGGRCSASANYGMLRIFGDMAYPGHKPQFWLFWSNPQATFRDVVTINHPTLNGSVGQLTITYQLDANLSASGQVHPQNRNATSFGSRVDINGYFELGQWTLYPDGTTVYGDSGNIFNTPRTLTGSFYFGEPFYVSMHIQGGARGGEYWPYTGAVDAEHTATWGGFNSVTTPDGTPVTNYSVVSASGADYTQPIPTALQATALASRKTHGDVGFYELPLALAAPGGVEPRTGGAAGDHTLIITFNNDIASGSANVSSGTGSIAGSPVISGKTMVVNLTGVANAQTVTLNLTNVTDTFGQVLPSTMVSVGFLLGDTNTDRSVNAGDALQTRNRSGQDTSTTNFRSDVNTDGFVNSGDALAVRSRSGNSL